MEFMSERLEKIFNEDEADPTGNDFGLFEKRVAQVTLLLSLTPLVALPLLKYIFKANIINITLVICAIVSSLFLIIHYRFEYIVWLTERLQQIVDHARIRI